MLLLLKDTSALREPILQMKATVEETKAGVEETKHTVRNIFKSIQGLSSCRMQWRPDLTYPQKTSA